MLNKVLVLLNVIFLQENFVYGALAIDEVHSRVNLDERRQFWCAVHS